MTSPLRHAPTSAPEDDDADPVGRVGREIIRGVDLDRVAALIERRSAAALLDELAGIAQALELAAS
ncbi:MAG TPA: hypothetical protein VFE72_09955, partial [Lysobacter sp.]|nr:hypothetical protein [Lysobacter sp.]